MRKSYILSVVLFVFTAGVFAQQDAQFTLFQWAILSVSRAFSDSNIPVGMIILWMRMGIRRNIIPLPSRFTSAWSPISASCMVAWVCL